MKSKFSCFLIGLGSVLAALFALDEIFLFLREAHLLSMHIEKTVVICLVMTPFWLHFCTVCCLFLQRRKALNK